MAENAACYCYILKCADGTYYTGWTSDPIRRLGQHNQGSASRYTRARLPVEMVYLEPQPSRSAAMKRERAIKALSRRQKQALIVSSQSSPLAQEDITVSPHPNPSSKQGFSKI